MSFFPVLRELVDESKRKRTRDTPAYHHICHVYNSGTMTITNPGPTTLTFDTEITNPQGMWVGTSPTEIVALLDGWYMFGAAFSVTALGAAKRLAIVTQVNAATVWADDKYSGSGLGCIVTAVVPPQRLNAGDVVTHLAYNFAAPDETASATYTRSWMIMVN